MAFRFPLAPLLHLRESVERQSALSLREASLKVVRAQEMLVRLDQFLATSCAFDETGLRAGRRAVELQFASLSRENFEVLRKELKAEIRRLELARRKAAAEYQRAYREREALEALRKNQLRRHQQEDLRRQQRDLDESYLLQRWRNPLG